jgi:PilZ domain
MIAPWLRTKLWRERDWSQTLRQIAMALSPMDPDHAARASDLGRAFEHVDPDRRRAIAAYSASGRSVDLTRAREIAIEVGWWPALARLAMSERGRGGSARLAVEEFYAWLDAGEPQVAALVASDALAAAPDDPWLRAVIDVVTGRRDASASAATLATLAEAAGSSTGWIAAARVALMAGDRPGAGVGFQHAVVAAPTDRRASALWLALLDDEAMIQQLLRVRLAALNPADWVDTARALGIALATRSGTAGVGLRLIRAAITQVDDHVLISPPGYIAMWSVLVQHAWVSGARPTLLAAATAAIEHGAAVDDRVWLATLGADIAWTDAGNLAVARAWAAVAAEHAPEHPTVVAIAAVRDTAADEGLVYLDRIHARDRPATESRQVRIALESLRTAVAHVDESPVTADDDVDIELGDLLERAPAADVAILTAAVDATSHAVERATVDAAPIMPRAALSALQRFTGRLPSLPPAPPRPDAVLRAARIDVPLDAAVISAEGSSIAVVCRDISTTGLFVLTGLEMAMGSTVELVVQTPTEIAWTEQSHRTHARVVRRESRGYGLELVDPVPTLVAAIERLRPTNR